MNLSLSNVSQTLLQLVPHPQPAPHQSELLREIQQCVTNLRTEQNNYDEITDTDLIDARIYRIMSLEAQYRYLLRRAKDQNLRSDLGQFLH